MPQQPEEHALRYHNYAAFLRRLASRTQPKRPAPDCVLSPINSTSLPRAFTALGLLPDRASDRCRTSDLAGSPDTRDRRAPQPGSAADYSAID